jgi:2-keto-3-deoxy-L-fuconate dehydrogenase
MRHKGKAMSSLTGKTAFVTAAGQGIGRATAKAFAAAGAKVVATDVDAAKLAGLESDTIRAMALDVLDPAAIARAAETAGAIDILFNCAGVVHQGTLLEASEADWSFAFDLNCRSMFRTMQAFLPGMLTRGRGTIINIASVASSLKGVPNRFIYSASKAAVIGMTRSVATDYVTRGIRCNCLCPGTSKHPAWMSVSPRTPPPPGRSTPRAPRSWQGSRWAVWARRRRSPRWRSICPATMPSSLPVRQSL